MLFLKKQSLHLSLLMLVLFKMEGLPAQNPFGYQNNEGAANVNYNAQPCITEEQYKLIEKEIEKNRKQVFPEGVNTSGAVTTQLIWPLEASSKLNDCDYYYISAYVDQNTKQGEIQDWNCGTRTYDGHRGVDIVPWPFIWNKMDSNLVRVIAAAPGTILAKVDGNYDRVCNGVGGGSNSNNYISIQHDDGSVALYVHLKTGAFTTKKVGEKVTAGEFLGIVGSAGQSTGVHLHFEIRSDGTFANYVDPFHGNCNGAGSSSWWLNQKPYDEPAVLKLSLHTRWPYMGVCPNTVDSMYESDRFISSSGGMATFYACSRDVAIGAVWNFEILDPDNKVIDQWNYTNNQTARRISTLGWNKALPTRAGTYTFQSTFNGKMCTKTFTIEGMAGVVDKQERGRYKMYPNPVRDELHFAKPYKSVKVYSSFGEMVKCIKEPGNELNLAGLPEGVYLIQTDLFILRIVKN